MASSNKLKTIIDIITLKKKLQLNKHNMNELPIQSCSTESDAQCDRFISGW